MNDDFINAVNLVSFLIGIQNLKENLSQNDKYEIMQKFDDQTKDILEELRKAIDEQNRMLKEILDKIRKI